MIRTSGPGFRIQGYDVAGQLTCDELILDNTMSDLRDLRPVADEVITRLNGLARTLDPTFAPVRLTHLSYPKVNGAGAMSAGDWTRHTIGRPMAHLGSSACSPI